MNDFKQRILMAYLTFSIGIPAIAFHMESNGGANPANTAWQLISTVRWIALTVTAVLVLGAAIIYFSGLLSEQPQSQQSTNYVLELRKLTPEELAVREAENTRWRAEQEERRRVEAAKEAHARQKREAAKQENERLKLESKRTRTYEEAVETALGEF